MQERVLQITLGDWSDDGHGRTAVHHVKLQGTAIDDAQLQENFQKIVERSGVNPFAFCQDYEQDLMPENEWQKILDAGLVPTTDLWFDMSTPHFGILDGEYRGESFPFLGLIMWYVTHDTDITWSVVQYDTLFGGSRPIVDTSAGDAGKSGLTAYGLFYS